MDGSGFSEEKRIDLEKNSYNLKEDKEKILRCFFSDMENGYILLCRMCQGQGIIMDTRFLLRNRNVKLICE